MARPLRVEFPGAVYHVTSRGQKKENRGQESGSGMSIDLCVDLVKRIVDLKLGHAPFLEVSAGCPRRSDCERSAILEG